MLVAEGKQVGEGGSEVSYISGERPKYPALARAIQEYYSDLLQPLSTLRDAVFAFLPIPDPAKQEGDTFRYLARNRRVIDEAIDIFLREMAGPDRSRGGFIGGGMESDTPDGIIQARNFATMVTGVNRAGQVMRDDPTLALTRESPAVRQMLDSAFSRLSESGKLRLEGVRDEIHGILTSATSAGLSPLETSRQLSKQFDQYRRFEFERLARTEAAFAAEAGSREQYQAFGVTHVEILLAAGACPICQAWEGKRIPIEEVENQPPYHPNCLCTIVPVGEAERLVERESPLTGEEAAQEILRLPEQFREEQRELLAQENAVLDQFSALMQQRTQARLAGDNATADRLTPQVNALRDQAEAIGLQRREAARNRKERLRQFVRVADPLQLEVEFRKGARFKQGRDAVRDGVEEFQLLVSRQARPSQLHVEFHTTPKRAFYDLKGGVALDSSSGTATIVHELGHWLEDFNPRALEAALRFLDRRTQGEQLVRLQDLRPGANYRPEEVTRPDAFISPYVGKEYANAAGQRYATEITSMGLEEMYRDPLEFARRDPDHFAFIWDLVRGRYR